MVLASSFIGRISPFYFKKILRASSAPQLMRALIAVLIYSSGKPLLIFPVNQCWPIVTFRHIADEYLLGSINFFGKLFGSSKNIIYK